MNHLSPESTQAHFHPLFFDPNNVFSTTPEVMLSRSLIEFETTKEDRDYTDSRNQRQNAHYNFDDDDDDDAYDDDDDDDEEENGTISTTTSGTISTTGGTTSTTSSSLSGFDDSSCRVLDDVRDIPTYWYNAGQLGRGNYNDNNNNYNNDSDDDRNVKVDNDPIVDHIGFILDPIGTYKNEAGRQRSNSHLLANKLHSTIYSEPPLCLSKPFSTGTITILVKIQDHCELFLSRIHNYDENAHASSGSFVLLRAKRKSPGGSPERFDLKGAILEQTICAVIAEHHDALKTAAAMKLQLKKAQAQIRALEDKHLIQEQQHRQELQDIFLGYFPDHPVNYSHYVGPLQSDVIESDTNIGPYSIVRKLGEGGFATVVECLDNITKKRYAMKKLDKAKMLSRFALTSLSNELRVLSQVRHDNIISGYEVLNGATHVYVVMELGHTSLFEYYTRHHNELNTSIHREMAIGLFQGLGFLHSIGIAHLDIKLENILVKSNVSPREFSSRDIILADFGLCSIADGPMDDIVIEVTLGTMGFYAPEMKLLEIAEGRKADMWSAGVTLLELVEGLPMMWMDAYAEVDPDNFRAELEDCLMIVADREYFHDSMVHDLVMQLLHWTPANRLTCEEVLNHDFLWVDHKLSL